MKEKLLFLNQVEQLNGLINLVDKIGSFDGKILKKAQWSALFDSDKERAVLLLNRYVAEAYVSLASQFPTRAELKGDKGDSIEGDKGDSIFGRRGKKGEPGKDAPTLDALVLEMQKMVDKIDLPAPVVQPTQVTELTKTVYQTIDFNVDKEITRSGKAIRDALELIGPEAEKLGQSAIRGLPDRLKSIEGRLDEVFKLVASKPGSPAGEWVGTTWEEAQRIAKDAVIELVGELRKSFEYYRQNENSYDVIDTTDTATKITKTFDTPDGDIIYTLNFDGSGNPSTATLTGGGLPEDVKVLKTYDFSDDRSIPLVTYT